ncbi:MAG TPA: protein kinase [Candidatus Acidoferrales bacterium]|nr:protein kinase [Candidatus Acidoferrales bacterium]
MTIQIGDIVGDYRVIEVIGSGGMGAVYKIEHLLTRRIEAMKLVPAGISADPERVHRFEREIQVQARLSHPNIAALYNALRNGDTIALIMEYVEGEPLQHILAAGPLPLKTTVEYASQVLSALAYAHQEGVIHRDVSPANIIITRDRIAKLTDFGLAKAATDLRVTTSGAPVGSPWYMSPEQVRGIEPIDGRTDIYAMGAVIYEALTGAKLFDADGAFAVMSAHVDRMPAPPSSRHPALTRIIDGVLLKALAKDPAQRYQSAEEFLRALQSAATATRASAPAAARRPMKASTAVMAAMPLVVMAATFGIARLLTRPVHVQAREVARPAASRAVAPPLPAPLPPPEAGIEPPSGTAVEKPAAGIAADKPAAPHAVRAPQPAQQVPARAAAQSKTPQPGYAIRVSGGEVESPAPASRTVPPPPAPAAVPEPPVVALPQPATPDLPPVVEEPEGPKAQKPGSRLGRALGKINPFKKTAKQ